MSAQEAASVNLELITKGLELLAKKLFEDVEECIDVCVSEGPEVAKPEITLRREFALILSKLEEAVKNFVTLDAYVRQNLDSSTTSAESIERALKQERNLVMTFMAAVGEVRQYLQGLI